MLFDYDNDRYEDIYVARGSLDRDHITGNLMRPPFVASEAVFRPLGFRYLLGVLL